VNLNNRQFKSKFYFKNMQIKNKFSKSLLFFVSPIGAKKYRHTKSGRAIFCEHFGLSSSGDSRNYREVRLISLFLSIIVFFSCYHILFVFTALTKLHFRPFFPSLFFIQNGNVGHELAQNNCTFVFNKLVRNRAII